MPTPDEIPRHLAAAAQAGIDAAATLARDGHVVAVVEPGDSTRYVISITATGDQRVRRAVGGPYVVASSFGPLYPWQGCEEHPSYVVEKWVSNGNEWTARVIAAFLTGCADGLAGNGDQVPATAASSTCVHAVDPDGDETDRCVHCDELICPDTGFIVDDYGPGGYRHRDGSTCFLHHETNRTC